MSRPAIPAWLHVLRAPHWVKNVIVLFPVLFGMRLSDPRAWAEAGIAFAAFCLAASAAYVFNDICDRRSDRHHPRKKDRPIAAGRIGVAAATVEAVVLGAAALAVALPLGWAPLAFVAAYLALQLAYSSALKHRVLLDVICLAVGFVLRAAGGAAAIGVEISPWLTICTFTLCLFMGFCKRHNEIVTLADAAQARDHRSTLASYTPQLLTHLITLSGAVAVISFLTYATSPMTVERFGTYYLIYTTPLVIYGVCRFAMLSMSGRHSDPTEIMLRDRPFQLTIVLWLLLAGVIVLKGRAVHQWLADAI